MGITVKGARIRLDEEGMFCHVRKYGKMGKDVEVM